MINDMNNEFPKGTGKIFKCSQKGILPNPDLSSPLFEPMSYDFRLLVLLKKLFIAKSTLKDKISVISQWMPTSLVILNITFWYAVINTLNFKPPLWIQSSCLKILNVIKENTASKPYITISITQNNPNIHHNKPWPTSHSWVSQLEQKLIFFKKSTRLFHKIKRRKSEVQTEHTFIL